MVLWEKTTISLRFESHERLLVSGIDGDHLRLADGVHLVLLPAHLTHLVEDHRLDSRPSLDHRQQQRRQRPIARAHPQRGTPTFASTGDRHENAWYGEEEGGGGEIWVVFL